MHDEDEESPDLIREAEEELCIHLNPRRLRRWEKPEE